MYCESSFIMWNIPFKIHGGDVASVPFDVLGLIRYNKWDYEQYEKCETNQDRFVWACAHSLGTTYSLGIAPMMLQFPDVDINGHNWESHTALTACLRRDDRMKICSTDTIHWLLSEGADPNASFEDPNKYFRHITPLMFVSAQYKPSLVLMLLKNGARVNNINCYGETAVHGCASTTVRGMDLWNPDSAVVIILDILDEAGANLDAHDCGFSPLMPAMFSGNQWIAVYLLCLNCDPNGGFDPQSPETSANISPLFLAVTGAFTVKDITMVLLLVGCRIQGITNIDMEHQPLWVKEKLTSPHRLQDLCMARIRTSLRHGPFGSAGGGRSPGLGGYRRLELGVRGLPIPLCLKRRVLMVGLRKLLREKKATFGKRGMKFYLNTYGFLASTSVDYFHGVEDADTDTYYDEVLV